MFLGFDTELEDHRQCRDPRAASLGSLGTCLEPRAMIVMKEKLLLARQELANQNRRAYTQFCVLTVARIAHFS